MRPLYPFSRNFMATPRPRTLRYKRSHFVTELPVDSLYSPAHAWIVPGKKKRQRIGLTKFATRMLGEMVDCGFEVGPGAAVQPGQIIGWLEGFKAISDLYCIAEGKFAGANPSLKEDIILINRDPHGAGWIYEVDGIPGPECMDVYAYRDLLNQIIDRLRAQQQEAKKE